MSGIKPSGMDPNREEINCLGFFCSGWCVVGVGMYKRGQTIQCQQVIFLIPIKYYYFSGETRTPNSEWRIGILVKRNPVPLIPSHLFEQLWSYLVLPGYKEEMHLKSHG